jgi:hypothetical protein
MWRGNYIPKKYPLKKEYEEESLKHGAEYSSGCRQVGIFDGKSVEHHRAFHNKMDANGKPLGRVQKNRSDRSFGALVIFDNSINAFYDSLNAEDKKKFEAWALGTTMVLAMDAVAKVCKGRSGAGGKSSVAIEPFLQVVLHTKDRLGNTRIHFHIVGNGYGLAQDGRILSVNYRPVFAKREAIDRTVQCAFASVMEREMKVGMEYCPTTKNVFVKGFPRNAPTVRKDMAKAYLAAKGIKPTKVAMAYAMKATRPAKGTVAAIAPAKVIGTPYRPGLVDTWLTETRKGITEVLKVYQAAWRAAKDGKAGTTRLVVNDVKQTVAALKKTPLVECHKAALRAVQRTRCESFNHALAVAKAGFKKARNPKIKLVNGAKIFIAKDAVMDREARAALEKIAAKNNCIIVRKNQEQEQQQEQGMKR